MNTSDSTVGKTSHLIICGGQKPVHFSLSDPCVSLGRTGKNQIQIHRASVSSEHLEFRRMDGGNYQIVDLDSRNGTTVNGISIGTCELCDGDRIVVGRRITIHYLQLATGEVPVDPPALTDRSLREFHSFHEKLDFLADQERLLQRRLHRKTLHYEELLRLIVELKQDPEKVFRKIYGEEEVHFPVKFSDRLLTPVRTDEKEEVALSS
ncbi:MAG: FHA domain-containing protein [Verrucomicrobiales bacterium]|nr:FHA domain-containing protein [Verrucomicrobiales bacterium]